VDCRDSGSSQWNCVIQSSWNPNFGRYQATVTETGQHYYVGQFTPLD
jgi:hypothetical protein